jgi:hypothetical protein
MDHSTMSGQSAFEKVMLSTRYNQLEDSPFAGASGHIPEPDVAMHAFGAHETPNHRHHLANHFSVTG